jgi:hypothetical protein
MTRQMVINGRMGLFGLGFVRGAVKASAVVAINAALATATFAQETPSTAAAPADAASASWTDQIAAYRKRLKFEANVCGTVKLEPIPGKNVLGSKLCLGSNGFNHGGNLSKLTLANDGLPGHLDGEPKATIGFGFATPEGGFAGGVEYNPADGAVKVSGGPTWGIEAEGSGLGAELSLELGATYTPPEARPDGSLTSAPVDFWQSQAALLAAREQQRLQAMTYQQKLAELSNMVDQGVQPGQLLDYVRQQNPPTSGQYPAVAPAAAQILTPAQMAAQMNGGMSGQATVRPQPPSSLPPLGVGAFNPPRLPGGTAGYPSSGTSVLFNEASKAPAIAGGQPIVSRPAPAPTQTYATGYSYNANASKVVGTAQSTPSSQVPVIPNISARIPGTQSQTAALQFPGD